MSLIVRIFEELTREHMDVPFFEEGKSFSTFTVDEKILVVRSDHTNRYLTFFLLSKFDSLYFQTTLGYPKPQENVNNKTNTHSKMQPICQLTSWFFAGSLTIVRYNQPTRNI